MKDLIFGILLMFAGQILIYIQTNGQFLWQTFKENPIVLAIIFGTVISYLFILGNKHLVNYFNGTLWESRLIGFGVGIVTFAILTQILFNESLTIKSIISLILASILVLIQIFWK